MSLEPGLSPSEVSSKRSPWKSSFAVLKWLVVWVVLVELAVTLLSLPRFAETPIVGSAGRYLRSGMSIEGKLRKAAARAGDSTLGGVDQTRAGWLETSQATWGSAADRPRVQLYGNSFTARLGRSVSRRHDVPVRSLAGPSAPPSHSYATALGDAFGDTADIVAIGVLSSSLHSMRAHQNFLFQFSFPRFYTFPRYSVAEDGGLVGVPSVVPTRQSMLTAPDDRPLMDRWRQQIREFDPYFHSAVFDYPGLDRSFIARLVRRAFAERRIQKTMAELDSVDLRPESDVSKVLERLLVDFDERVRSKGQLPVVLLFNHRRHATRLDEILLDRLRSQGLSVLSSNRYCPAGQVESYLPDGHLALECEGLLADALVELGRAEIASSR